MKKTFYTIESFWSKTSHLSIDNNKSVCGAKIQFPKKSHETSFIDGYLKQNIECMNIYKWTIIPEYGFCKRCLKILKKETTENENRQTNSL